MMNPIAVVFWMFCATCGYLVSETMYAAVAGLAIGLGISLLVSFLPDRRRR